MATATVGAAEAVIPSAADAPTAEGWTAPVMAGQAPSAARRILRGLAWGPLYGQWWTLWTIISTFLWQRPAVDGALIFTFVVMGILYGMAGSVTGFIIGATNASENTGTNIGIGAGITLCLLEMALTRDFGSLINLVFYYFTGRYVGAGIAGRVHQPVR